jgi:1,4-dihydroxy-2-naphthoate polyprenyltransferase
MKPGQLVRLARVPTLAATAVPVLVGGALALEGASFSILSWLDILLVALLMQIATNALNEYGDFVRKVDTAPTPGIAGVIVSGELKPRDVLAVAVVCYACAFALGVLLVLERGVALLVLGVAGICAGVVYSEGPFPVSSTPFGEALVGLIMGPIEVVSTDIAATGGMSKLAIAFSVPVALMVTSILLANNLRDIDNDKGRGRRTLAVLLGRDKGLHLLLGLFVATYAWAVPMSIVFASPSVYLVWLSIPVAYKSYSRISKGEVWPISVAIVARLHIMVGALVALSIVLRF